jgi:hypothetical protein
MQDPDIAVVVASCDKYSDLWNPLFDLFFQYWPDCPFPLYLVANRKRCDHPRVTTLLSGEDRDWSSSIRGAVQGLSHRYFMFWIDDAFLVKRVDTSRLVTILDGAIKRQFSFLRLRPDPKPATWLDGDLGELGREDAYRVSLFASVWSVPVFHQLLKDGESAWEFELNGTERSRTASGFYCARRGVFSYLHGVERGIWIRPSAMELKRRGYLIEGRPIHSRRENIWRAYRQLKNAVFHLMPARYRVRVLRGIQESYRIVGLRK